MEPEGPEEKNATIAVPVEEPGIEVKEPGPGPEEFEKTFGPEEMAVPGAVLPSNPNATTNPPNTTEPNPTPQGPEVAQEDSGGLFTIAQEDSGWLFTTAHFLLDMNPFNLYSRVRSDVNMIWHTVATILLFTVAILGCFGLIYIHASGDHYEFECLPAGSVTRIGSDYHIGMCECTSSSTLKVELDLSDSNSHCKSQTQFDIPGCIREDSLKWFDERPSPRAAVKGLNIISGAGCFAAAYTCTYGTCFPSGEYYTYSSYSMGGGTLTNPTTLSGMSRSRKLPAFVPSVKCCGFKEQSNLSQALVLMGAIGGTFSLITTVISTLLGHAMISK